MEVICVGEMLIDFTPGSQPASYIRNPGGAPANACIAMARNGISTGFLGKLGNDDFGRFLKETLEKDQVEVLCPDLTDEAVTTPMWHSSAICSIMAVFPIPGGPIRRMGRWRFGGIR